MDLTLACMHFFDLSWLGDLLVGVGLAAIRLGSYEALNLLLGLVGVGGLLVVRAVSGRR